MPITLAILLRSWIPMLFIELGLRLLFSNILKGFQTLVNLINNFFVITFSESGFISQQSQRTFNCRAPLAFKW